jgi:ATP synthase I chain
VNENVPDSGQIPVPPSAAPVHPILEFTDADLAALLKRVVRATAILGAAISLLLWLWMGWQTGALFAVGAAISIGSIYEWSRLIRHVTARLDGQKASSQSGRVSGFGTGVVVSLFLLRLVIFAVVIYGSLKCFHGSPIALLCGLGLALAGLVWEAMRLLRG